jgi:hypothetical protein
VEAPCSPHTLVVQDYILKSTKAMTMPSTGAISLPNVEAVIATCGSAKQFLPLLPLKTPYDTNGIFVWI